MIKTYDNIEIKFADYTPRLFTNMGVNRIGSCNFDYIEKVLNLIMSCG